MTSPALILVAGALAVALAPARARRVLAVAAPLLALAYVASLPLGTTVTHPLLGWTLEVVRVDALSRVFGLIFAVVAAIGAVFAWGVTDRREQVAAQLYAAGALGVTFAGDVITLYAFWELMAVTAAVLVWVRDTAPAHRAGLRYVLVHLTGGAVLLVGLAAHVGTTGRIAFEHFEPSAAAWLILIGFCLNAAVPPLGAWLPDAYPKASVTGAVLMSALTTKSAVYALLRGFAGWEVLVAAGVFMALYGVVYAVLANDIRELLAYHIISQVGYMVAGCGLGTAMAVNGAVAHAVCHILYKSLLFMGAGVVITTTGRSKLTELGGFVGRQRLVFGLYMIGAFSISGFPLWNGFVSKSMVVAAAGETHRHVPAHRAQAALLHLDGAGPRHPSDPRAGPHGGRDGGRGGLLHGARRVAPGPVRAAPEPDRLSTVHRHASGRDDPAPALHLLRLLSLHSEVGWGGDRLHGHRRGVPQGRGAGPPPLRRRGGCRLRLGRDGHAAARCGGAGLAPQPRSHLRRTPRAGWLGPRRRPSPPAGPSLAHVARVRRACPAGPARGLNCGAAGCERRVLRPRPFKGVSE
jgi:formate hydrogenlyase subunit 3/multisubunit Na+/H+ antiporter MnhD subunit